MFARAKRGHLHYCTGLAPASWVIGGAGPMIPDEVFKPPTGAAASFSSRRGVHQQKALITHALMLDAS